MEILTDNLLISSSTVLAVAILISLACILLVDICEATCEGTCSADLSNDKGDVNGEETGNASNDDLEGLERGAGGDDFLAFVFTLDLTIWLKQPSGLTIFPSIVRISKDLI